MSVHIENIYKVLQQANRFDWAEGKLAYVRYRGVCQDIARKYDITLEQSIAIFAALSPNNHYVGNVRASVSLLEGHTANKPLLQVNTATYNHRRDAAWQYLHGVDFWESTGGPKIRNFYLNIMNPFDPEPVTIDGHARNMWLGRRTSLKKATAEKWDYDEVANDFRAVAKKLDLLPNQLQAITWFAYRRIHKIGWKGPQVKLFGHREDDFWETLVDLDFVRPYEDKKDYGRDKSERGNRRDSRSNRSKTNQTSKAHAAEASNRNGGNATGSSGRTAGKQRKLWD